MWNYKLASRVLYEFFYGNVEIDNYDVIIHELSQFLRVAAPYGFKRSDPFKVEYKKIKIQNHIEKIRNILRLDENSEFFLDVDLEDTDLDMFVYNDGEVHFNDDICLSENAIFQYLHSSELMDLASTQKIILYAKREELEYDKLIISPDFINSGYGEKKIHILPGDWLIVKGSEILPCNFKLACKSEIYSLENISPGMEYSIYPETLFKREMIKYAAKWYAGFLPGISKKHVTHFHDDCKIAKFDKTKLTPLADFQYEKFVIAMIKEIYTCNAEHWKSKIFIIKLGYCGNWGYPDIIDKALIESGIKIDHGSSIFPYRSEMDIYSNGLINFNDKTIYVHPDLNLFSKHNLDLKNAPLMIFKGDDFKVLKIKVQELESELYGFSILNGIEKIKIQSKYLYVKFKDSCFKNGEKLENYSDSELIAILQNPQTLEKTFDSFSISYEPFLRSVLLTWANSLGEVKPQPSGDGWYQYYTKPARVVKINEPGIINLLGPISLEPGDFLLAYDHKDSLCSYSASSELEYTGYLCDEKGNILDNTPHFPGHPEVHLLGFQTADAA